MIIVGLGNIGKEYEKTHHNIGFMMIDKIAKVNHITFKLEKKFQALVGEYIYKGQKHLLIKPTTYMNNSGLAVKAIMDYYKADPCELFVLYDDLDLPTGTIRIRKSGSSGGHNGIKSIIQALQTETFARLRVGIAKKQEMDTISYVLAKFTKEEMVLIDKVLEKIPRLIDDLLEYGIDYIMNHYNGVLNEIS